MNYIIPIPPKPQSRPRFSSRGGFVKAYEDKDMTAYKKSVRALVLGKKPVSIEKGPVSVTVRFYVYPPAYLLKAKKKRADLENERIYVDKKPDIDNLFKAVTDSLNGVLYHDDSQIVVMAGQKLYSLNPRTEIEIDTLDGVI